MNHLVNGGAVQPQLIHVVGAALLAVTGTTTPQEDGASRAVGVQGPLNGVQDRAVASIGPIVVCVTMDVKQVFRNRAVRFWGERKALENAAEHPLGPGLQGVPCMVLRNVSFSVSDKHLGTEMKG